MNKKGIVFTRPRDTISFFVGLVVAAFGILPLLAEWGIVGFNIPLIGGLGIQILIWLVAVFGLYVVIDGFIEPPAHSLHMILIVLGIIMFAAGLVPLLNSFGVIGFTIPLFGDSLLFYRIILSLEGIALVVGGLTEH